MNEIAQLLTEKKLTVCTAESCTGGLLASIFTDITGSSNYFNGSIVAYNNDVKCLLLNIDKKMLHLHSAVSSPVSIEMATNAKKQFNASISIAVTGYIENPYSGYYTIIYNDHLDHITRSFYLIQTEKSRYERKKEVINYIIKDLLIILFSHYN